MNFIRTSGADADGATTYGEAEAWVNSLVYGGYDDWRLPRAGTLLLQSFSEDEITALMLQLGAEWITPDGSDRPREILMPNSFSPFVGRFVPFWIAAPVGESPCLPGPQHCFVFRAQYGMDFSAFHWSPPATVPGPTPWAVRDGLARVPEPSTWLLVGLGTLAFLGRKRMV
jgi:hypothetical protein